MQNVTMLSQYATIVSGVQQQQHLTVTDINNRQRGNQVKLETSLENDVFFQNAPKPGTMQPLIVDETRQYMEGLMDQDDDSDGEKGDKSDGSKRSGKKTRGRVKIKMEFIQNKLRRYTTFSKRKTGIMKKAYELSTLTGTQVMLLVASETGHVYTFATRKLQPMITSESGKALIQTCLNSPDPAPTTVLQQQPLQQAQIQTITQPMGQHVIESVQSSMQGSNDQRMAEPGVYQENNLQYQNNEELKIVQSSTAAPGSVHYVTQAGQSFPITTYIAPVTQNQQTTKQVQVGSITTIFTPSAGGTNNTTGTPSNVSLQTTQTNVQQHQQQPQIISGQLQLHRIHPQNIILTGNAPCIQQNHIILNPSTPSQTPLVVSNTQQSNSLRQDSTSSQQHDVITLVNPPQHNTSTNQPIQMIYNSSGNVIYAARQQDALFKRPSPLLANPDQLALQHTPVIQASPGEQGNVISRQQLMETDTIIVPRNHNEIIK